ncbi:hypothetical protein, partial [Fructobacillus tropaeoli]
MFRKLEPDSELGKQVSTFISKNKEGQLMTKKFTEEEYQKIADCFDKVNKKYNMGLMNPNVLSQIADELFGKFNFIDDWEGIFAIANPATRDEAHEKFVEKENKYYWKSKKQYGGRFKVLVKSS